MPYRALMLGLLFGLLTTGLFLARPVAACKACGADAPVGSDAEQATPPADSPAVDGEDAASSSEDGGAGAGSGGGDWEAALAELEAALKSVPQSEGSASPEVSGEPVAAGQPAPAGEPVEPEGSAVPAEEAVAMPESPAGQLDAAALQFAEPTPPAEDPEEAARRESRWVAGRDFRVSTRRPDSRFGPEERDLGAIRRRGELVVAQYGQTSAPFFFFEPGSERLIGYDVDLAQALARSLGVKLTINRSFPTFQAVADAVEAGEADIAVSNLSVTDARKKQIDFSEPYLVGYMAVLLDWPAVEAKLGGREVIGVADLNRPELTAAYEYGSAYDEAFKEMFPQTRPFPEVYEQGMTRYDSLLVHKVDFVFGDNVAIRGDLAGNPRVLVENGGPLSYFDIKSTQDPYAVGVAKTAPELLRFVNQYLERADDTMTISSLLAKYRPSR